MQIRFLNLERERERDRRKSAECNSKTRFIYTNFRVWMNTRREATKKKTRFEPTRVRQSHWITRATGDIFERNTIMKLWDARRLLRILDLSFAFENWWWFHLASFSCYIIGINFCGHVFLFSRFSGDVYVIVTLIDVQHSRVNGAHFPDRHINKEHNKPSRKKSYSNY